MIGSQESDINSSSNKINRLGTIFDEHGKLLTNLNELDVYKNYSNNFRSNIIKNDSASSCSSGSQGNIIHINTHPHHNNNNHIVRFADDDDVCTVSDTFDAKPNQHASGKALGSVRFLSVCGDDGGLDDDDSGKSCKRSASINSITSGRPFKSSSLDDDIEFIDTSSSLSDIGGGEDSTYNSIDSTIYYNTLPKLPKACATCKAQQQQHTQQLQANKSKSEWNISINNKVR